MGYEIQGRDNAFVASFFAQFACTTLQQNGTVRLWEKQNAWERGTGNNEAQPKGPAPIDGGDESGHEWRDDGANGGTLPKSVNVEEIKDPRETYRHEPCHGSSSFDWVVVDISVDASYNSNRSSSSHAVEESKHQQGRKRGGQCAAQGKDTEQYISNEQWPSTTILL